MKGVKGFNWCRNCAEWIDPPNDHSHLGWCVDCFRAIVWTAVISATATMIANLALYQLIWWWFGPIMPRP